MCSSELCLGYVFLLIGIGFSILVFFLLKYRRALLRKDLQISAESLWKKLSYLELDKSISKSNIIFGVWQDKSATVPQLIFKNANDEIIGQVEYHLTARAYEISLGNQIFRIEIPLTWQGMTANLKSSDGKTLATFKRKSLSLGSHKFFIQNIGELTAKYFFFKRLQPIQYFHDGKHIGSTYQISSIRRVGRVGIFPAEYSLPVKVFIIVMGS